MKSAIFLATVALLAMLSLAPVALAQGTTIVDYYKATTEFFPMVSTEVSVSGSQAPNIPPSGGPAILLPAATLLLGAGILTYAILRRR
jgi:hypothetical protein